MLDNLPSTLIPCPTCGGKDITFRETRHIQVYFRQRPGAPPSQEPLYNVIYQDERGCLYETKCEITYPQDVQAVCHSCGLKWILTDCKSTGDLQAFHDSGQSPAAQPSEPAQPQRRKIKASEVVADIESGISDHHLMSKYDVTPRQLEFLLQKLLHKGLVTQKQLDDRVNLADTTVTRAFVDTQKSLEELDEDTTCAVKTSRSFRVFPHPEQAKSVDASPFTKSKRTIRADEIVADLDAGVGDSDLMQKYGLLPQQLELLYKKLLDSGLITVEQLYGRTSISGTTITKAFVDVYKSLQELDD